VRHGRPSLLCQPRQALTVSVFVWQSSMNAMGSLSILSPDRVLPQLISTITTSVQNPALCQVTREEFAIMQTPAGELYDKSIIQR